VHLSSCRHAWQPVSFTFLPTRRNHLIHILVFLITLFSMHPGTKHAQGEEDPASKPRTVELIIDFGDHFRKHYTDLTWSKGMTVKDVLQAASKHPRGIRFEYRGKGKTAFLISIDKLKNEGRGRNWVYRVNKKLGDRSFADFVVQPGDAILWTFGKYR